LIKKGLMINHVILMIYVVLGTEKLPEIPKGKSGSFLSVHISL